MLISIVIPAFNEAQNLKSTLDAIHLAAVAFKDQGWQYECIVCDNNSTDGTGELAKNLGATVAYEPINQISRARNKGAQASKGEWLIFIDADSRPTKELFHCVVREIRSEKTVGGGSVVLMESNRFWFRFCVASWNIVSVIFNWAAGSFIYCRIDAFQSVNGFSEDLFAAEEIDFSKKLKRWAKKRDLKFRIIREAPLWSSARKEDLYTTGEWLSFFGKALLSPVKTLKQRQACQPWYDGRR